MRKKQYIDHERRKLIYQHILKHPYLHLSELARKLQIPKGTLTYHLRYLEKNGLIISNKEDRYTRYCAANNFGNIEKKLLNVFRQDTARSVLLYIMLCLSASQIEIAKELGKDPKTIEFHLKRLAALDIIERVHANNGVIVVYAATGNSGIIKRKPSKNEIFYRIKEPEKIKAYATLLKYYNKNTINDPLVDAYIKYIENVAVGDLPKTARTGKQAAEAFEKILWDIFPHPYYA